MKMKEMEELKTFFPSFFFSLALAPQRRTGDQMYFHVREFVERFFFLRVPNLSADPTCSHGLRSRFDGAAPP